MIEQSNTPKTVGLLAASLIALVLVGCGGENGEQDDGAGNGHSNDNGRDGERKQVSADLEKQYEKLPERQQPAKLGPDLLKRYYPEGRISDVKTNGFAQGTATNREFWGFQGNYWLNATSNQSAEWEVMENNGRMIKFRVHIPVSVTNLWAARRQYTFHPPDAPLAIEVLRRLLSLSTPTTAGPVIQNLPEIINTADPNLKRTATAIKKFLEKHGLVANEIEQYDLKVRQTAKSFQNATTTVVYKDGLGFVGRTEIEGGDLNDKQKPPSASDSRRLFPLPGPTATEKRGYRD
jgi:hypothetical protein